MYVNYDPTAEPMRHRVAERNGILEPEPAAIDTTVIPDGEGSKIKIKIKTRNGLYLKSIPIVKN